MCVCVCVYEAQKTNDNVLVHTAPAALEMHAVSSPNVPKTIVATTATQKTKDN